MKEKKWISIGGEIDTRPDPLGTAPESGSGPTHELLEILRHAKLIDPDCKAGKHSACVGEPCECPCHSEETV
jgi:hypothetical protein